MSKKFVEDFHNEERKGNMKDLSKPEKQEIMNKKDQTVEIAATAYSMLFVNAAFLILVLFFGPYMMKQSDVRIRFILSMPISAAVVYWISNREGKRRVKEE